MPFTDLLEGGMPSGTFKSVEDMRGVFEGAGVDLGAPMVCSCGSGATGALLSLAAFEITGTVVRPRLPCLCHVLPGATLVGTCSSWLTTEMEDRSCFGLLPRAYCRLGTQVVACLASLSVLPLLQGVPKLWCRTLLHVEWYSHRVEDWPDVTRPGVTTKGASSRPDSRSCHNDTCPCSPCVSLCAPQVPLASQSQAHTAAARCAEPSLRWLLDGVGVNTGHRHRPRTGCPRELRSWSFSMCVASTSRFMHALQTPDVCMWAQPSPQCCDHGVSVDAISSTATCLQWSDPHPRRWQCSQAAVGADRMVATGRLELRNRVGHGRC